MKEKKPFFKISGTTMKTVICLLCTLVVIPSNASSKKENMLYEAKPTQVISSQNNVSNKTNVIDSHVEKNIEDSFFDDTSKQQETNVYKIVTVDPNPKDRHNKATQSPFGWQIIIDDTNLTNMEIEGKDMQTTFQNTYELDTTTIIQLSTKLQDSTSSSKSFALSEIHISGIMVLVGIFVIIINKQKRINSL